jgi:hypothetical protein
MANIVKTVDLQVHNGAKKDTILFATDLRKEMTVVDEVF